MKNKSRSARTTSDVKKMSQAPKLFVRFKSDTCPHCVSSQPGWNAMVKKLNGYTMAPGCMVGEVESALADSFQGVNEDGSPFQVGPVPAYEFFVNGKRQPLEQPGRDADALLEALQSQQFLKKRRKSRRTRRR
jgi:hypothetical protein